MKYLNILIVGYGSIGKKHHSIIKKKFNKHKVLIISKHRKTKLKINSINKTGFDKIIICTSSNNHIKNILSVLSLERKVDILLEKPLSNNLISKHLISKIKKKLKFYKSNFQVGYCLRYHPMVHFLKKFVKKNMKQILESSIITNSYLPNWRKGDYSKHVSSRKELGGGVLNELSHELDLMYFLFGKPKSLVGLFNNSKLLKGNVEDNANILFAYKNNFNLYLHIDFNSYIERQIIEIKTKNCVLTADLINKKIRFNYKNYCNEKLFKLNNDTIYENQLKNFLDEKRINSVKNLMDANYITKLIFQIKKSNKLGKMVKAP